MIYDAIREHAGNVPLVTKLPLETVSPPYVRQYLTADDIVTMAQRLEAVGYDAVVPVEVSVFWDMSVIRGAYPERAWEAESLQDEYASVFGSSLRAKTVSVLNRLEGYWYGEKPAWNEGICRQVREAVSIPVLAEGGIRSRRDCDRLLGDGDEPPAADLVGMGRPFYAEPKLPARILHGDERVLCESCNNCTVPQAAGEPGRCRTPRIVRARARLERDGAYERERN